MIRRIFAIAQIAVLETIHKKHVYVLGLILLAFYFLLGRFEFFNLGKDASFVRLVPLTGIQFVGLLVAVLAAARQLPDETAQKTILPMLAKPISRFEFLLGKFGGVLAVTVVAMAALAGLFQFMLTSRGVTLDRVYWQAVYLQALQMCVMISLVLCLSTLLSYAATVVVSLLAYYLLGTAGSTLEDMIYVGEIPHGFVWFYKSLLLAMPRLDLFNITKAVVHGSAERPWTVVIPFTAYAAVYSLLFLMIGALRFRRKDL